MNNDTLGLPVILLEQITSSRWT